MNYVLRETTANVDALVDSIEAASVELRKMESVTKEVTKAVDSFEKEAEQLNKAAEGTASALRDATNKAEAGKKVFNFMFDAGLNLGKMVLTYNDAARKSIRGTSLMGTTAEEMTKRVSALTVLGPKVAGSLALGAEESMKLSTNLMTNMQRMNRSMNIDEASKQVQGYADSVKGSSMMLNMSVDDMVESQNALMGRARLNIGEMKGLMQEAGGYAASLGLEGRDMTQIVTEHMDIILAMDKKSRKDYISDLAYTAGVQKRAAVDFGKFANSVNQQQGVDAMTSEVTLEALSGLDRGEISWAISQASVNPEAAKALQKITESSLGGLNVNLNEYKDLYTQRAMHGKDGVVFSETEATRLRTLEEQAGTVTKVLGKTLPEILGMAGSLENLKESAVPTKAEAKEAGAAMATDEAQKQLQNSLIDTSELTNKYTAEIAKLITSTAEATVGINAFADGLRTATAALSAGNAVSGGAVSGITDLLMGGLGMVAGGLMGPILRTAGRGIGKVGRGVGSFFSRGGGGAAANVAEEAAEKVGKEMLEGTAEKAAKEAAVGAAEKAGSKAVGKAAGKSLGKAALKKVPVVGALVGAGLAVDRIWNEGDWLGGGLELASGILGSIPGLGTAASVGIDVYSAKRDMDKEMEKIPEVLSEAEPTVEETQKESELRKDVPIITDVEEVRSQSMGLDFKDALEGIELGGIERGLGGNRRVIESIVPILTDMRDSLSISRASSLVSAFA